MSAGQGETLGDDDLSGESHSGAKTDDENIKHVEDDDIFTNTRWNDEERSALFQY